MGSSLAGFCNLYVFILAGGPGTGESTPLEELELRHLIGSDSCSLFCCYVFSLSTDTNIVIIVRLY